MKKKNSLFCFTTDAELEKASFLVFCKPFLNVCVCLLWLRSYSEILDQSEKWLPGRNALAYLLAVSINIKKLMVFITDDARIWVKVCTLGRPFHPCLHLLTLAQVLLDLLEKRLSWTNVLAYLRAVKKNKCFFALSLMLPINEQALLLLCSLGSFLQTLD